MFNSQILDLLIKLNYEVHYILTTDTEENIDVEGLDIQVVPVWKWILQSI